MSLGIKNPLIQINLMLITISKQKIEILERFSQEERLHLIPWPGVGHIPDISNGCVSIPDLGMLLYPLEDVPPPFLVRGVPCEVVHVEQTLHCLWPQKIMGICRFHNKVRAGGTEAVLSVEMCDFGGQVSGLPGEGEVAGVEKLLCQGEMAGGETGVDTESEGAGEE